MNSLSLKQPWASWVADGQKTIETRKYKTNCRGELLICSSLKPVFPGLPCGQALAVVNLVDCRPMTKADEKMSMCEIYPDAWSWMLTNIRKIRPFEVKGHLGFYGVDYRINIGDVLQTIWACRKCGCTDKQACEGGCHWVESDLCSRCWAED